MGYVLEFQYEAEVLQSLKTNGMVVPACFQLSLMIHMR